MVFPCSRRCSTSDRALHSDVKYQAVVSRRSRAPRTLRPACSKVSRPYDLRRGTGPRVCTYGAHSHMHTCVQA